MYVVQIFALHRWPHVGCYSCYVCHRSATVCMNVRFMTWHTYIHVLLCVCVCDTPHPPPFHHCFFFAFFFVFLLEGVLVMVVKIRFLSFGWSSTDTKKLGSIFHNCNRVVRQCLRPRTNKAAVLNSLKTNTAATMDIQKLTRSIKSVMLLVMTAQTPATVHVHFIFIVWFSARLKIPEPSHSTTHKKIATTHWYPNILVVWTTNVIFFNL